MSGGPEKGPRGHCRICSRRTVADDELRRGALKLLRDRRQSVADIAQQLGYSSEAAFRRLFKRVSGLSPGRLRVKGTCPTLN